MSEDDILNSLCHLFLVSIGHHPHTVSPGAFVEKRDPRKLFLGKPDYKSLASLVYNPWCGCTRFIVVS